MPIHPANETELLEALTEANDANECFFAAYDALDDTIDALLKSIFHKDDYAVKFVVEPLLTSDGPLGDLMIRAKLLLGLGVVSKVLYDDIEIFVTLKEWAKFQEGNISFTEPDLIFELNKVDVIQRSMPIEFDPALLDGMSVAMQNMSIERHNQKVKSIIVLAVTEIVERLCRDNELM